MTARRVFAFGHSHLGPLIAAYEQQKRTSDLSYELTTYQFLRNDRPHIVKIDKTWQYNPEIERELTDIIVELRPDLVVMMLQGEQIILTGLTVPEKYYDCFFPGDQDTAANHAYEIIPFDLMLKATLLRYELIGNFIPRIRHCLPDASLACCPPPPAEDVRQILQTDTKHAEIAETIERFGLPPAPWRQRIWKLHTLALRTLYQSNRIRFLEPPYASFDPGGFLRPEFRSDLFHGNINYGKALLQQISGVLCEGLVEGASS
ncbi:hypothetical protein [Rhodopila globiformis]|uniref:SGNH/GDSL hydrolase family protein n=1 Tax=Rhodopila globiformis TaxID=1071 RepID=A0A2S6N1J9_RHOGL|nr:hypothetical protein [Rhodopila globiformis]PPQ28470.1 hypothetical protein CCS01_24355 [Rhodopila globiformis]